MIIVFPYCEDENPRTKIPSMTMSEAENSDSTPSKLLVTLGRNSFDDTVLQAGCIRPDLVNLKSSTLH